MDRELYKSHMQSELAQIPGLEIMEGSVEDLMLDRNNEEKCKVTGVVLGFFALQISLRIRIRLNTGSY